MFMFQERSSTRLARGDDQDVEEGEEDQLLTWNFWRG